MTKAVKKKAPTKAVKKKAPAKVEKKETTEVQEEQTSVVRSSEEQDADEAQKQIELAQERVEHRERLGHVEQSEPVLEGN